MRGKVHDRIHPPQRSRQSSHIGNIAPHQLESGGQKLVPRRQIVIDHNLVPTAPQGARRMASDISRSSNDQNDQ